MAIALFYFYPMGPKRNKRWKENGNIERKKEQMQREKRKGIQMTEIKRKERKRGTKKYFSFRKAI
jgi:hypothetical protein